MFFIILCVVSSLLLVGIIVVCIMDDRKKGKAREIIIDTLKAEAEKMKSGGSGALELHDLDYILTQHDLVIGAEKVRRLLDDLCERKEITKTPGRTYIDSTSQDPDTYAINTITHHSS